MCVCVFVQSKRPFPFFLLDSAIFRVCEKSPLPVFIFLTVFFNQVFFYLFRFFFSEYHFPNMKKLPVTGFIPQNLIGIILARMAGTVASPRSAGGMEFSDPQKGSPFFVSPCCQCASGDCQCWLDRWYG